MNKLTNIIPIAAILLATASCQQESIDTPNDPTRVEFRISLPDGPQTRAESENILKWTVFEIKDGATMQLVNSDEQPVTVSDEDASVPITLELLQGHKYQVAFAVTNSANTFATFQDGVVTVNYEGVSSNSDADDIFVGKSKVLTVTGDYTEAEVIKLHRPFAQLNWSTSDLGHTQVSSHIDNLSATVSVSGDIYRALDIIDSSYDGRVEDGLTFGDVALSGVATPLTEEHAYSNLTTNYLLIKDGEEQQTLNCAIHFDGHTDVTVNVNNASAKPNYRTNIFGALLTNGKSVTVTMEEGFANNKYTGISENDVIENILAGENIVVEVGKTLDLRRYQNIKLKAGQKLTVNGTLLVGSNAFVIEESGEPVVIDGAGKITQRSESSNVFVVKDGGTLNLSIASFPLADNTSNVLVVNSGGILNINNTIFTKSTADTSERYAINVSGGTLNAENTQFNIETGVFTTGKNAVVNLKNCNIANSKYYYRYAAISTSCNACFENCNVKTYKAIDVFSNGSAKFEIKGQNGSYESTASNQPIIGANTSGVNILIEGGKFKSTYSSILNSSISSYESTLNIKVIGGYFNKKLWSSSSDYSQKWIPEGYEWIENSTAVSGYPYEVRKKEEVTG